MPMPPRLTIVGDLERPDHYYLPPAAKCYFWGEYTSGKKWDYSDTNQLILNFKKKMDRRGHNDWRHKVQAIDSVASQFAGAWKWDTAVASGVVLIPMPPSKARNSSGYDPRMLEVIEGICRKTGVPLDVRDCLSFSGKYAASHETDSRPNPDQLFNELSFDPLVGNVAVQPRAILLFDDMLTTGGHYVAAARRLGQHFPGAEVIGQFVARRIIPNPFGDIAIDF